MTAHTLDYNRIFLRDYAAPISVGILPSEKFGPQTIIVNIECEAVTTHRFDSLAEESLDRVVDYTQAHKFISTELCKMPHIPLLETVAELIASFCLRDPRVANVRVRLEKPNIMTNTAGAGVEIFRIRSGM